MATEEAPKPLFRDIDAEDDDPEVTEIESLCVGCEDQGVTRLFLTRIPFFKNVIVSSFSCDHCGLHNTELQPGGQIQDKGIRYKLTVTKESDLNRQVVQTDRATISIPQLEFEVPPNKGALSTVEGMLDKAIEGLEQDQPVRRVMHPDIAAKIDNFVEKLKILKKVESPFVIVVDDPSGNSFIENPHAPNKDDDLSVSHYTRTEEQDKQLGIFEPEEKQPAKKEKFDPKQEVVGFPTNCPDCSTPCTTKMKMIDIPYFKEVIIMATTCEACGHRDNEVKGGTGIEDKGTKITLHITDKTDMSRDILKSDTCSIAIPELDFDTEMGTLGGRFTTVEGLLINVTDQLKESNPFFRGDSSQPVFVEKINSFCDKIHEIISGERLGVHLILDDPAGNSYIQNVYAPEDDPELTVVKYERSFDQNEELGLNDMVTENYS